MSVLSASHLFLKPLLLACLLLLTRQPSGLSRELPQSPASREELDRQFGDQLARLALWCSAQDLDAERKQTEQMLLARDPQRQYIFLPEGPGDELPEGLDATWRDKLQKLRRDYAQSLFELARELADKDAGAPAYQLLHEVLYWDSGHLAARQALGHQREGNGWQVLGERLTVRDAPRTHPELKWPAGSYRLVSTENFEIASQADEATTRLLAEQLQRWHWIWRQVCFDFWSSPTALRAWIDGKSVARESSKKYRVVFFRDREQYVEELEKSVPGVAISTGYYSEQMGLSFFFSSQTSPDLATWRHELVHQLFKETIRTRNAPFVSGQIWLGEGIAMYFEGLNDFGKYVTLGGFDTQRVQYARLRGLQEKAYLPFAEFSGMNQAALLSHAQVRQLYSQAAGLTQFLMTTGQGRYRAGLIEFLKLCYQGKPRAEAWEKTVGLSPDELDRCYPDFLKVQPGQVERDLLAPAEIRELVLPAVELTAGDLQRLAQCGQLRWLDLSDCSLKPGSLSTLAGLNQLEELDVSGVSLAVDDLASLHQLASLRILRLARSELSAESLAMLVELESLEQLDLRNSKLSSDGLKRLKAARPKLKILE